MNRPFEMNRDNDRHRKVADYLYEELGYRESEEMEKALLEDPQLSESYLEGKLIRDHLKSRLQLEEMRSDPGLREAERLADQLLAKEEDSGTHGNRPSGKSGGRRVKWLWAGSAMAAAVALLFVIFALFPKQNPGDLYNRYYEPLAATNYVQRGSLENLYPELTEGINHYLEGEYREAIRQFNTMTANPGTTTEAKFFTALSYMGLEQYGQAKELLVSFVENSTRYLPEALWYLSLASLQTGDLQDALQALDRLAAYDGLYQDDARSLRDRVRRIIR